MPKPKAIQWLEEQTGQSIDYEPDASVAQERHLSVRLSAELSADLDAMARERRITVSHLVRELLADVVSERAAVSTLDGRELVNRLAADVAEVRRRLAG
jgi:hypothetical protein